MERIRIRSILNNMKKVQISNSEDKSIGQDILNLPEKFA